MRRTIQALISTILLGVAPGVLAEDLLQIYDKAVVSDPTLREAEQTLFATREVKPQAQALLLPNLSAKGTLDYTNVDVSSVSSSGSVDYTDDYSTQEVQGVVTQALYNRGSWMTLRKADNVIAQAEAEYRKAQIDLMVRTTEAYFDVLRASDGVTVQEALLRANERHASGTRYLGDGAWAVNTRETTPLDKAPYLERAHSKNHVFVVTLHPDRAEFTAVDPNGEEFDRFTVPAKP